MLIVTVISCSDMIPWLERHAITEEMKEVYFGEIIGTGKIKDGELVSIIIAGRELIVDSSKSKPEEGVYYVSVDDKEAKVVTNTAGDSTITVIPSGNT
jgi:hypothetical protein